METAATTYNQYIQTHSSTLSVLKKRENLLAWSRFLCVIVTILLPYFLFPVSLLLGWMIIITGTSIFLFAVAKDVKNKREIDNSNILININKEELSVLDYQYFHRENGSQFTPPVHAYANDLDVFGNASLYQYINRCNTEQGKALFANNLLVPIPFQNILQRQQAINELNSKTEWQQGFQAIALQEKVTINTQQKINLWLQEEIQPLQSPAWKIVLPLYIAFTFGLTALYLFDVIPASLLSAILFICFVFASLQSKKVMTAYVHLSKIADEISVIEQLIKTIEVTHFKTESLKLLQQNLQVQGSTASQQINSLKNILNLFDVRLNILLFFFLNTFLLWDVWQMRALNRWKNQNKNNVNLWFETIAEMEVINTLSVLAFNHPHWCVPTISDTHFTFSASEAGHPLINIKQSVTNSFTTNGIGQVTLITGSNMAGKSTFLRSIGCNVVLALLGSRVCANVFTTSHIKLLSSMRIADNLAENTSTFYAELKKLQSIIEAVNKHEKVFILLDEILRGTNSLDRHTGSKALIKQLIKKDAVAILATHDIELAKEENNQSQNITNYHFDVQVANDELYFDYKLKKGICQSLNASILMRKIGIEMEE